MTPQTVWIGGPPAFPSSAAYVKQRRAEEAKRKYKKVKDFKELVVEAIRANPAKTREELAVLMGANLKTLLRSLGDLHFNHRIRFEKVRRQKPGSGSQRHYVMHVWFVAD